MAHDDPMAYRTAGQLVEALATRRVSSRELVDGAIANLKPGITVLIKGSRSSAMERVVAALVKHAKGGSDAA